MIEWIIGIGICVYVIFHVGFMLYLRFGYLTPISFDIKIMEEMKQAQDRYNQNQKEFFDREADNLKEQLIHGGNYAKGKI